MWFKKKKPEPENNDPSEGSQVGMVKQAIYDFNVPMPRAVLRPLKNPLFDTESASPDDERLTMFEKPIGHKYTDGTIKTPRDTNMTQASCLPPPIRFDFYRWRTEFDPAVKIEDVLSFRFNSRISFRFGPGGSWFSSPLSYVPFTAYLGIEELKRIAPVLIDPSAGLEFRNAWLNAQETCKVEGETPWGSRWEVGDKNGIYYTEEARDLTIERRPVRIRSNETFFAAIDTDWDKVTTKYIVGIRLFLEGIVYTDLDQGGLG